MELEEKQTNGLIRMYLIEVNLSQLMGLRQKLKLSIWLSLTVVIWNSYLHNAIKRCKFHHFVDDTRLFMNGESFKKLKLLNLDLKYLCRWLKATKISLNASKTEVIIFHHPNKSIYPKNQNRWWEITSLETCNVFRYYNRFTFKLLV